MKKLAVITLVLAIMAFPGCTTDSAGKSQAAGSTTGAAGQIPNPASVNCQQNRFSAIVPLT